jgi:hypothetical protein
LGGVLDRRGSDRARRHSGGEVAAGLAAGADPIAQDVLVVSGGPLPLPRGATESPWSWIYFGRSTERYYAWRSAIGRRAEPLNAAALVNDAVAEFHEELLNFDEVLAYRSPLLWHSTTLAERDVYNSTFLFRCAAALAFEHVLDSLAGNLLVAVDDDWFLARKLARRASERGLRSRLVGGPRGRVAVVRYRMSWMLRAFAEPRWFLTRFFRSRLRLARARPRLRLPSDLDTLIVTWAQPHTFAPGRPTEREAFSGELPAVLRSHGKTIGYLACPVWWVYPFDEVLANTQAAGDPILLLEECVEVRDALSICARTLVCPARPVRRYVVGGLDLTDLLADALRHEVRCWDLQFFVVGKALARRGVRPKLVIHPFENAAWEKTFHLGIRRSLPETRIVGYQHSTVPFGPSGYFPSKRDISEVALPDTIVVNGRLWGDLLRKHGYPAERLRNGPALRFPHIIERLESPPQQESWRERRQKPSVLIAAAGGFDEALELVCKSLQALADWDSITLLVKLHPTMPGQDRFQEAVARGLGIEVAPSRVEFTTQSINELLESVDVLLHTKSSTAYEALAYGVPIVFVCSDFWFDRNPLPPDSQVGQTARSPEDIRAAVHRALSETDADVRERHMRARALLEYAFSPVEDETLRPLLEPFGPATRSLQ